MTWGKLLKIRKGTGIRLPNLKAKLDKKLVKVSLNGVYSEKFGGSRVYAKVRYCSGTVVLDILFYFYLAAILY